MSRKLFYIWAFNPQDEGFVPCGVYNTREEAEHAYERMKREDGVHSSGAVLEETFQDFVYRATQQRLGAIAPQIERLLAVIEDKPIGTAKTEDGRIVQLYGAPAFPVAIQKL